MTRTARASMLALVALLIAAYGASAASAASFTSDQYRAIIREDVSQSGFFDTLSFANGQTANCTDEAMTAAIDGPSGTITFPDPYLYCNGSQIATNGCDFSYTAVNARWSNFTIGPSTCGGLVFNVGACTITVPPQTQTVILKNVTLGTHSVVQVKRNATQFVHTISGQPGWCPSPGTYTNGTWGSWYYLDSFDITGNQTNFQIVW